MYKKYLDILFDPEDLVCASDTPFGVQLTHNVVLKELPQHYHLPNFISINPMHTKRADANVTKLRNILLEFDTGTIAEQMQLIRDSKLPFSTITFSGKKSIHVIISLKEPIVTRDAYDVLVRALYARFPTVDKTGKNPSRFTRMPGAYRDGVLQELLAANGRVAAGCIYDWLGKPIMEEMANQLAEMPVASKRFKRILSGHTLYFLNNGAEPGAWNKDLFMAALDMFRSGRDESEVLFLLREVTGTLDRADMRTIASARKASQKE